MSELARNIARHRWIPLAIAAAAILLAIGSLSSGLALDDYYLRWVISGSPALSDVGRSPMDAFSFVDGDPIRNRRMVEAGMLPWWIDPHVKAAFWKPLTVLTHMIDFRLWPSRVHLMHAQSLFWFGLWIVSACVLYRQIMRRTVAAALAGLLYAIDYSRAVPVAWLANRNAVMAGLFGILAIVAHYRSCRKKGRLFAVLSPVLLAACLLSAETGIGAVGYLLAVALTLDPRGWWRGLLRLWPHLLVVIAWRFTWSAQGYGVHAVDVLYTDPLRDPFRFAQDIMVRLPMYLFGQWSGFPTEVALVLSPLGIAIVWAAGVATMIALLLILLPILRRSRIARFWGLGMVLSAIPMCSSAPMNRHLVFIGVGAMGLLGQLIAASLDKRFWSERLVRRVCQAAIVGLLVAVHCLLSPIAFAFVVRHAPAPEYLLLSLHTLPEEPETGRYLIFINHPIPMEILDWITARAVNHEPLPRGAQILAPATTAVQITRVDGRSLLVRPDRGFLSSRVSQLGYSGKYLRSSDGSIELPVMRISIQETTLDGRPAAVLFRFHVPLEDSALEWVNWQEGAFRTFHPPAVGKTVSLPASSLPF